MWKSCVCVVWLLWLCPSIGSAAETVWQEHPGRGFSIFYQKASKNFVENVDEMTSMYFKRIVRDLGFSRYQSQREQEAVKIYIFDSQADYIAAGPTHWSNGTAFVGERIIRTFPTAHGFFDSTLPHELGHIIFRDFIGQDVFIPAWFEEGVAMYQEQAKRYGVDQVVRDAMASGTFLSLSELDRLRLTSSTARDTVNLFYAESASIVNFLITEYGKHRFVRLCQNFQKGMLFPAALKSAYVRFDNLERLNKMWIRHLKD